MAHRLQLPALNNNAKNTTDNDFEEIKNSHYLLIFYLFFFSEIAHDEFFKLRSWLSARRRKCMET